MLSHDRNNFLKLPTHFTHAEYPLKTFLCMPSIRGKKLRNHDQVKTKQFRFFYYNPKVLSAHGGFIVSKSQKSKRRKSRTSGNFNCGFYVLNMYRALGAAALRRKQSHWSPRNIETSLRLNKRPSPDAGRSRLRQIPLWRKGGGDGGDRGPALLHQPPGAQRPRRPMGDEQPPDQ
jgi:hypothetical protein